MRISDLLRPEAVLVPLRAADRHQAIAALVDALPLGAATPANRAAILSAVLAREASGSTAIGSGVAIPHARTPHVPATLMALALLAAPVAFESADSQADGQAVNLVFLLAIPAADPHSYLPVLAALSRMVSDEKLLRRMKKAASREELFGLISDFPL